MSQSLRDLKQRLKDLVKAFQYETETAKTKGRAFYRLAKDAIDLAERLEIEIKALRQPQLSDRPPTPYVPSVKASPTYETRAQRIRAMISGGPNDRTTISFLRWSKLTYDEALEASKDP